MAAEMVDSVKTVVVEKFKSVGNFLSATSAPPQKLSEVKKKSTLLKPQEGPLEVYQIPLKEKQINIKGCNSFSFGKVSKVDSKQHRTIMVLGATGAGKTTLINGMINYILGVRWEDSYRFKLVDEGQSKSQAHSQTSEVTVYKINHLEGFEIPYSLTIIDTPGFGDTRGIERDHEIIDQLRNLFSSQDGVTEIDAICFVAQASLARLTATQKYVFDSILSIFGKDVAENIRILVTFADGQRPPVLEAINESGVPCPKDKGGLPAHFKFNNSAVFADNKSSSADNMSGDDEEENFDQMFWNMGTKSMKRFFSALNLMETKSLTLTKEVLKKRQQLEASVEGLQKQVKLGLAKLEEIKETKEKLREHEAKIRRNENFELLITVKKPNYRGEYKEVTEKRTVKELKDNYEKATGEKMTVQGLMNRLEEEYKIMQDEVVRLMGESATCLNRLKEIALKPNPLSTPEYIDMLIEGEKQEGKPGFQQRIQSLMKMKERAVILGKVGRGEKLPASL